MKLEPPLKNLVARCQTICVPECCGLDAYDFSPIQIASYLTLLRGTPDENEIETIQEQLSTLQKRARFKPITIEEMNQIFTADAADDLSREITTNMKIALDLIKQSDERRICPTAR